MHEETPQWQAEFLTYAWWFCWLMDFFKKAFVCLISLKFYRDLVTPIYNFPGALFFSLFWRLPNTLLQLPKCWLERE